MDLASFTFAAGCSFGRHLGPAVAIEMRGLLPNYQVQSKFVLVHWHLTQPPLELAIDIERFYSGRDIRCGGKVFA